jgi:Fic family protein
MHTEVLMDFEDRKRKILAYIETYSQISNNEAQAITGAHRNTISKDFSQLVEENILDKSGSGKGAKYTATANVIFDEIAVNVVFPKESERKLDKFFSQKRRSKSFFNRTLEKALSANFSYSKDITKSFLGMKKKIKERREALSTLEKKRKEEKLIIDLSWASSNIEGNTYSLLETESLIKYNQTTKGKTFHEAKMILNHKSTLEYIRQGVLYKKLSKRNLFELHQLLTSELEVRTGFREHLVAITNSSYVPCDNQFQIAQFFDQMIKLINVNKCVLTKAVTANLLIAYLQPFSDGNKRTSRMAGNAILLANNYLPISFVHTPKEEYIKSILYFYEKQDPSYFKQLFLSELNHSFTGYDIA